MRTISERCVVVGRSFLEGDDDVRPINRPYAATMCPGMTLYGGAAR
jgi:hypothetical protein